MPVPGTLSGFPSLRSLQPNARSHLNFRTPAGNAPPIALPTTILGVPMQDVILDPTKLLTAALSGQTISSMVVINIATVPSLLQQQPQIEQPQDPELIETDPHLADERCWPPPI